MLLQSLALRSTIKQTGDVVKAIVTKGKKEGVYKGRVAVRKSGRFNIKTKSGTIQGISYKHLTVLQKVDGYADTTRKDSASSPPLKKGVSALKTDDEFEEAKNRDRCFSSHSTLLSDV